MREDKECGTEGKKKDLGKTAEIEAETGKGALGISVGERVGSGVDLQRLFI